MNQPRASLRSDSCPTSIGIPVRYGLEQLSAFIGIRRISQRPQRRRCSAFLCADLRGLCARPERCSWKGGRNAVRLLAQRGAAFMPLRRGQPFGERRCGAWWNLKRRERRAPPARSSLFHCIATTKADFVHQIGGQCGTIQQFFYGSAGFLTGQQGADLPSAGWKTGVTGPSPPQNELLGTS